MSPKHKATKAKKHKTIKLRILHKSSSSAQDIDVYVQLLQCC